jgi:tetratricopeptide (TPR) repeat protein
MQPIRALTFLLLAGCSVSGSTRALTYYARAHRYAHARDYDRAIAYYDTTITLFVRELASDVYTDRGEAYYGKGLLTRAIADFDTSLAILPEDSRTLAYRAVSYLQLGQRWPAIADFDKALRLDPKLTWARYRRAHAWVELDSLRRAIADLDTVLTQWQDRRDVLAERARLRQRVLTSCPSRRCSHSN